MQVDYVPLAEQSSVFNERLGRKDRKDEACSRPRAGATLAPIRGVRSQVHFDASCVRMGSSTASKVDIFKKRIEIIYIRIEYFWVYGFLRHDNSMADLVMEFK